MDQSKYVELRHRLRQRAMRDATNREFNRRFVLAMEAYMNARADLEKKVFFSGTANPGADFEEGTLSGYGSITSFALLVRFHDASGKQIFQHAVPFKVRYDGATLTVRCDENGEKVSLTTEECYTDKGKQMVADMLDEPLQRAVDDVIRKLDDAAFNF